MSKSLPEYILEIEAKYDAAWNDLELEGNVSSGSPSGRLKAEFLKRRARYSLEALRNELIKLYAREIEGVS
jgi:hypothetical protein